LNTSSNSVISGGASSVINKKTHAIRKVLFQSKCTLKSHLDSVRGIHFVPASNAMATASEDCTIKIWDVNRFCNLKDAEGALNFEPYVTLRGHLSPIMSLSGCDSDTNSDNQNLLISGSKNGTIKMWKVPSEHEANPFGQNLDSNNHCI